MQRTAIVVPCYNEEKRLKVEEFLAFVDAHPWAQLWFVNDGSSDGTMSVLHSMKRQRPANIRICDLSTNRGKAEAVRQGMLAAAADRSVALVGFWDADLATPLTEVPRFVEQFLRHPDAMLVMGSRIKLLGHHIRRKASRAFCGRMFATLASLVVQMPVYDTQCGAKLFRNSPRFRALIAQSFLSRWIFDVELLVRLRQVLARDGVDSADVVHELPLLHWEDVHGSKLKARDFAKAFLELAGIQWRYRRDVDVIGEATPIIGNDEPKYWTGAV